MASVTERVKSIVADKAGQGCQRCGGKFSFTEDLEADSLDLVELIMAFEEEFSTEDNPVEISDDDAATSAPLPTPSATCKSMALATPSRRAAPVSRLIPAQPGRERRFCPAPAGRGEG